MALKQTLKSMPILGPALGTLYLATQRRRFQSSHEYWNSRYHKGGNSGAGSYSKFARFKAEVLNPFVHDNGVRSVFEFGCGDGNQLGLSDYPRYIGYDISPLALETCRKLFADHTSKEFKLVSEYAGEQAELSLSLDVIYHLVEDDAFDAHMRLLFVSSARYVGIYASNTDEQEELQPPHVRHRKFTDWVEKNAPGFAQIEHIANPYPYNGNADLTSFADFYFFEKQSA